MRLREDEARAAEDGAILQRQLLADETARAAVAMKEREEAVSVEESRLSDLASDVDARLARVVAGEAALRAAATALKDYAP